MNGYLVVLSLNQFSLYHSSSCKGTQWSCTSQVCPGTCSVYGELNYITFDRRRYTFSGPCEYVLVQDSCNGSSLGTFQIQVQNIPCGGSGLTCTKKMSIIINNTVIVLEKEKIPVVFPLPGSVDSSVTTSFQIRELHFFTVLQTEFGLTITWDRGTRLYITLDSKFTGQWLSRIFLCFCLCYFICVVIPPIINKKLCSSIKYLI